MADLADAGLKAGDVGTVLLLHGDRGCEVEFMSPAGTTSMIVSVQADQLVAADPATIPQASVPVPAA